jgi:hypothetical protein
MANGEKTSRSALPAKAFGKMVRARTCRGHGKSVSFAISKHFTKDLKVACESRMGFAIR